MSFLLSTLRDWKVTFEAIALQKPALLSNNYHQAKYFIAEPKDTNKKEFKKWHGHVFQLYISFKNDFHKVYVAEKTSF